MAFQFFRRSPESMGLQPDGDLPFRSTQAERRGQPQKAPQETHFTLAEALRTSPFWYLTIGTALRIVALTAVAVHYVPIMVWKGMSQTEAAFLLGAQSFLGVPATLILGWLGPDQQGEAHGVLHALRHAVDDSSHFWTRTLADLGFPAALHRGGSDFLRELVLCRRIFRARQLRQDPRRYGFVQAWGAVIGPVVAGAIYDRTQSYVSLLWGLVGILLIVGCLYALIVKPSAALHSETAPA
jgi:cyanate permease